MGSKKASQFFMFNNENISSLIDEIAKAVTQADYSAALTQYAKLYELSPQFLSPEPNSRITKSQATHIHNAANLARRALFETSKSIGSTDRMKLSVAMLCGVSKKVFDKNNQKPSFLYVPDLPSVPFSSVDGVDGLRRLVTSLNSQKHTFKACIERANEKYVHEIGEVPVSDDWVRLSENWNSMHLMKGGVLTKYGELLPDSVKLLFESPLIAHCPPHAAEVVVSILQPDTKIPPHYGISNIKWTLHIPLVINDKSYLEVAGEKQYWHEKTEALLFDDSFIHSAQNGANTPRAVLIIDLWNPHLSSQERDDIKALMRVYGEWSKSYGALAALDRRFY